MDYFITNINDCNFNHRVDNFDDQIRMDLEQRIRKLPNWLKGLLVGINSILLISFLLG
jgi:hypothetical protein